MFRGRYRWREKQCGEAVLPSPTLDCLQASDSHSEDKVGDSTLTAANRVAVLFRTSLLAIRLKEHLHHLRLAQTGHSTDKRLGITPASQILRCSIRQSPIWHY